MAWMMLVFILDIAAWFVTVKYVRGEETVRAPFRLLVAAIDAVAV